MASFIFIACFVPAAAIHATPENDDSSDERPRLEHFSDSASASAMTSAAIADMARLSIDTQRRMEEAIFIAADGNEDHRMSLDELRSLRSHFDQDADGHASLLELDAGVETAYNHEFENGAVVENSEARQVLERAVFEASDVNSDGRISLAELREVVHSMDRDGDGVASESEIDASVDQASHASSDALAAEPEELDEICFLEEADKVVGGEGQLLFKAADVNGDGRVTGHELIDYLSQPYQQKTEDIPTEADGASLFETGHDEEVGDLQDSIISDAAQALFRGSDGYRDSIVSRGELTGVFHRLDADVDGQVHLGDDVSESYFHSLDHNQDGYVSLIELEPLLSAADEGATVGQLMDVLRE